MDTWPYIFIIITGLAGFFLALHIFHKKRTAKPLVCPLNSDCNAVIHSSFSTFFGIPLEVLGMIYYLAITLSYSLLLIFPNLILSFTTFLLLTISTFAFAFSLYLTFIQAFAIKEWCIWCLISAGLCTIIFLTTIFGAGAKLTTVLLEHFQIILTTNIFALALGVGGITFYNIFFMKFLRDLKISQTEKDILLTISQVIWFSIFFFSIAGLGLLAGIDRLGNIERFSVGIIILAVIILNEIIINIFVAPKLIDISFGKIHPHRSGELRDLRRLSLMASIVSLLSWYSLLIILLLPAEIDVSAITLFTTYIILVVIGFATGLFLDRVLGKPIEELV